MKPQDMSNEQLIKYHLAEFMHDIEEWQSMIEGKPTNSDLERLEGVYNDHTYPLLYRMSDTTTS